jgi:hypothetical protein
VRERDWPSPKDGNVRRGGRLEKLDGIDVPGGQPRPELAEALAAPNQVPSDRFSEVLGQAMGIREAAALIGCSAWTVRQKHVPAGLPHLRSGPNGKLLFYKNQVIRWLLRQQQKGGPIA